VKIYSAHERAQRRQRGVGVRGRHEECVVEAQVGPAPEARGGGAGVTPETAGHEVRGEDAVRKLDRPAQRHLEDMVITPPWSEAYWMTERGVATIRVTLICSRSISVGTLGAIGRG
jgi:hypothetical protein